MEICGRCEEPFRPSKFFQWWCDECIAVTGWTEKPASEEPPTYTQYDLTSADVAEMSATKEGLRQLIIRLLASVQTGRPSNTPENITEWDIRKIKARDGFVYLYGLPITQDPNLLTLLATYEAIGNLEQAAHLEMVSSEKEAA